MQKNCNVWRKWAILMCKTILFVETWNAVALLLCTDVGPIAGKRLIAHTLPYRSCAANLPRYAVIVKSTMRPVQRLKAAEKNTMATTMSNMAGKILNSTWLQHTHKHQNDIVFCHKIVHLYDDACCYITFVTSIVQCCGATRPRRPNRGPVIAILLMLTWESWWCSSRLGPWYESLFLFFESGASVLTSC